MQNERSTKRGARKQRAKSGERDVLSPAEFAAFDRGQLLKRYVRAAAALAGLFDDTAIADAVGRGRITVGKWWTGVRPEPEAIGELAQATGLSTEELTRFVYFDGPAADPAGRLGCQTTCHEPSTRLCGKPSSVGGRGMETRCTAFQGTAQCILQAGHAGEHRADWSAAPEPVVAPAVTPKRPLASPRRIALSIGGLILILLVASLAGKGNHLADTGGESNVVPPAWQPASFTLTEDRDVAYRWLTDTELDCDIADRCWGMFVVSKNGCSSLYVELAIIDDAGNNVGYTNDLASGVAAGQQAKLIFDNFENKGSKARLSKVSCL